MSLGTEYITETTVTSDTYPQTPFFANIDGDLCRVESIRTEIDSIDVYQGGKRITMPGKSRIVAQRRILKTGTSALIDVFNMDIISDDVIEKDYPEYVV